MVHFIYLGLAPTVIYSCRSIRILGFRLLKSFFYICIQVREIAFAFSVCSEQAFSAVLCPLLFAQFALHTASRHWLKSLK